MQKPKKTNVTFYLYDNSTIMKPLNITDLNCQMLPTRESFKFSFGIE